jgi:molybdopterin-binding protein
VPAASQYRLSITQTPNRHHQQGETIMKISARNILNGKIVALKRGAVMAQVVVELAGGNRIASAIFVESVDDLGLKIGDEVAAVIKSTDVMIARP